MCLPPLNEDSPHDILLSKKVSTCLSPLSGVLVQDTPLSKKVSTCPSLFNEELTQVTFQIVINKMESYASHNIEKKRSMKFKLLSFFFPFRLGYAT